MSGKQMFKDAYEKLAETVRAAGFYTNGIKDCGSWQRTIMCSMRLPGGRLTGNSFWVTHLHGRWYLGAWGGEIYKLPDEKRIAELCITWLRREPIRTCYDFDEALKRDFDLQSVTDQEFDQATGAT